jgi:hypothetical protein
MLTHGQTPPRRNEFFSTPLETVLKTNFPSLKTPSSQLSFHHVPLPGMPRNYFFPQVFPCQLNPAACCVLLNLANTPQTREKPWSSNPSRMCLFRARRTRGLPTMRWLNGAGLDCRVESYCRRCRTRQLARSVWQKPPNGDPVIRSSAKVFSKLHGPAPALSHLSSEEWILLNPLMPLKGLTVLPRSEFPALSTRCLSTRDISMVSVICPDRTETRISGIRTV